MARKLAATPAPQTTPRAAIYVRVSTDEQAQSGFGLDVQRARCAAMITVKGWQLAGEYADEGISGTKRADQRPGLARLLADVAAHQIDAVIVLGLDRLGRKTAIVLELVETFTAAGAVLVSCKESLDTSTPQGAFVLTVFAALAQLERDTIVERTTAGRNARGLHDGEKGGALPYGYRRTAAGPVVDEQQAKTVCYILRHRRSGKSYHRIADDLNTRGVPGPRGGRWYGRSVQIICDNKAIYTGGQRGQSSVQWLPIVKVHS